MRSPEASNNFPKFTVCSLYKRFLLFYKFTLIALFNDAQVRKYDAGSMSQKHFFYNQSFRNWISEFLFTDFGKTTPVETFTIGDVSSVSSNLKLKEPDITSATFKIFSITLSLFSASFFLKDLANNCFSASSTRFTLTVYILSKTYPGLSLGIPFFTKQKSKWSWGSGSLGYGGKASQEKVHIYIQRVSLTRLNVRWVDGFKHKSV